MSTTTPAQLLRTSYPVVLARVLGQLRDLPAAEDAVQEAMARAIETWNERGTPDLPEAWLVRVAVNFHRDELRRRRNRERNIPTLTLLAPECPWSHKLINAPDTLGWRDDLLRLVFTCCDPVLGIEERTALALATVAGLSTPEIARAFLVSPSAMERRLSRARQRLRERRGHYEVPRPEAAPERIDAVLAVIHFVYNEGYWASEGVEPIRHELTQLALSLARSLDLMLPGEPEVQGLLAILLLHQARLPARRDVAGEPLTLEEQDRTLWEQDRIEEAHALLDEAVAARRPGPFQIEAAIAMVHCSAPHADETDWEEIASLYRALERHRASPVVRVNRAFAVSRARGAAAGLEILDSIADHPALGDYSSAYLVRGVLLEELGRRAEARDALRNALERSSNGAERKRIEARLAALDEFSEVTPRDT